MQIRYSGNITEPLTLDELKSYMKVPYDTDDVLIQSLLTQVRELAEEASGLALVAKTVEYFEEDEEILKHEIKLPYPNHDDISEVTMNGVAATYTKTGLVQFIIKVSTALNTLSNDAGLIVKYTTTGDCPAGVKLAMMKEIAETYEKRGSTTEMATYTLTSNFYNYLQKFKVY